MLLWVPLALLRFPMLSPLVVSMFRVSQLPQATLLLLLRLQVLVLSVLHMQ